MTQISVLFLTKYAPKGASSRYRAYNYSDHLEEYNIETTYKPLFSNKYLEQLFEGGNRNKRNVCGSYVRRIYDVASARAYDLVVIQKELLPYVPPILEQLFSTLGIKYLLDMDDAIFHNYDKSENIIISKLLSDKIDHTMRRSEVVIAGNESIASRARQAGAQSVEIIPTVIDLAEYPDKQPETAADEFTIGWIGSPSTAHYVEEISNILRQVAEQRQIKVRLIGSGEVSLPGVPHEVREWSEETEIRDLRDIDVGIMPLHDTPWTRGKCGFKLIQYMGAWKPVVASPIGVNCDIVDDGVNGYLADSQKEWMTSLLELCDNPTKRKTMGENGRSRVKNEYCYEVTAPRFADIIKRSV